MTPRPTRRQALHALAAATALPSLATAAPAPAAEPLRFLLRETAGLRRFGYPVRVEFPANGRDPKRLQLRWLGKPVPAQFRPVPDRPDSISLEFNSSTGAFGESPYEIREGEPHEGSGGMTVKKADGVITVANGRSLSYQLPENLDGFLTRVTNGKDEYVASKSTGLFLHDQSGRVAKVGGEGTTATVTREGPLAIGLHYTTTTTLPDGKVVGSTLDLTFPNSKSWVEVFWMIRGEGASMMGLDLNVLVGKGTTLADFGAGSTVYTQVLKGERCEFEAEAKGERPWTIRRGRSDSMQMFAAPPKGDARKPEGWAHLMDSSRCTALSVEGFGEGVRDRIVIDADGRLQVSSDVRITPRGIRFWLHFVPMPVQVGAVTSPQAMLAPLEVEWVR